MSRSFYEQSFGEPRWRPSPIPVKAVAAGRLGRKSGRGYYDYRDGTDSYREPDPDPPPGGGGDGLIVVHGALAAGRRARTGRRFRPAGRSASPDEAEPKEPPFLILDLSGGEEPDAPLQGGPQAICCAAGSLAALDPGGAAVGFHALPPLEESTVVELTRGH